MDKTKIKSAVREQYGAIASQGGNCCGPQTSCCSIGPSAQKTGKGVGYSETDLAGIPEGADLGLGCGNPVAMASLKEGETVLDLGSGAGIDCFLASQKVGESGRVIGVDMTPEMLEKARVNNEKFNYRNVEFRLGEIENLPVADNTADAVISNCVINLSPDKDRVFAEAYRVLKPGGRMMVSDITLKKRLPQAIADSIGAYVGCVAGALLTEEYIGSIRDAGFVDVKIAGESNFPMEGSSNDPVLKSIVKESGLSKESLRETAGSIVSVKVFARKPE